MTESRQDINPLERPILAVIPARGGSRGIPKKNLRTVGGISLVGRAGRLASSISWIQHAVVSTDDAEIAEEATLHGLVCPAMRPAELATDEADSYLVWRDAHLTAEDHFGFEFEVSILLEPTSPLRTVAHLERAIQPVVAGDASAVATVSKTAAHFTPHKTLCIHGGEIRFLRSDGANFSQRQRIPDLYHRNGICYAAIRDRVLEGKNLLEKNCRAVVIDEPVVNIDEPFDLEMAEWLFSRKSRSIERLP